MISKCRENSKRKSDTMITNPLPIEPLGLLSKKLTKLYSGLMTVPILNEFWLFNITFENGIENRQETSVNEHELHSFVCNAIMKWKEIGVFLRLIYGHG